MPRLGLSPEALQQLLELAGQLALFTDDDDLFALDPHRPRPASRKVVKDMKRIKLNEEALQGLGATRMECPVCMEGCVLLYVDRVVVEKQKEKPLWRFGGISLVRVLHGCVCLLYVKPNTSQCTNRAGMRRATRWL